MEKLKDEEYVYAVAGGHTLKKLHDLEAANAAPGPRSKPGLTLGNAFNGAMIRGLVDPGGAQEALYPLENYAVEKLGNDYVIKCPPVTDGSGAPAGHCIPDGATRIPYTHYLKMKADATPEPVFATPVRTFTFT